LFVYRIADETAQNRRAAAAELLPPSDEPTLPAAMSKVVAAVHRRIEHVEDAHNAVYQSSLDHERKLADLKAENVELKAMLGRVLTPLDETREVAETEIVDLKRRERERAAREQAQAERSDYVAEVKRQAASMQFELQQRRLDSYLAERDTRLALLETKMDMLLHHLSLSDTGLPKGL
jgi:hypothetical protein